MSLKAITRNTIVNKEKVRDISITDSSIENRIKTRIKYNEVFGDKDNLIEEIKANINKED